MYNNERECPFCKLKTLEVLGNYAASCHDCKKITTSHIRMRKQTVSADPSAKLSAIFQEKSLQPVKKTRDWATIGNI